MAELYWEATEDWEDLEFSERVAIERGFLGRKEKKATEIKV